jgi:GxxExxY protein
MKYGRLNELTSEIIGAAIEVHSILGPGLLESAYEQCMCRELALRKIRFTKQRPLPIEYKGLKLKCGYRLDICVEGNVIIEIKSVAELANIHDAQVLTYLKLSGLSIGLLLNFNVPIMKHGIRRIVHKFQET